MFVIANGNSADDDSVVFGRNMFRVKQIVFLLSEQQINYQKYHQSQYIIQMWPSKQMLLGGSDIKLSIIIAPLLSQSGNLFGKSPLPKRVRYFGVVK